VAFLAWAALTDLYACHLFSEIVLHDSGAAAGDKKAGKTRGGLRAAWGVPEGGIEAGRVASGRRGRLAQSSSSGSSGALGHGEARGATRDTAPLRRWMREGEGFPGPWPSLARATGSSAEEGLLEPHGAFGGMSSDTSSQGRGEVPTAFGYQDLEEELAAMDSKLRRGGRGGGGGGGGKQGSGEWKTGGTTRGDHVVTMQGRQARKRRDEGGRSSARGDQRVPRHRPR